MIITFNELRRIKDRLPSGSSQRIADELGIDVDTVRNYFVRRRALRTGTGRGCRYVGRYDDSRCCNAHLERAVTEL